MSSKREGRNPKRTRVPVDRRGGCGDDSEDADLTSVEDIHPAYTEDWLEGPALGSEDEGTGDDLSHPKSLERVSATAAAPLPRTRADRTSINDISSLKASSVRTKPHETYNDELVENTVYRVSAKSLLVSPSFAQHLEKGGPRNTNPIELHDVTVSEMDCFLRLLNAKIIYDDSPKFDLDELTSILRLSTWWKFSAAREWTIQQLSKISQPAIKRVELAHFYRVGDWLEPAYLELCSRSTPFSADEMAQLLDLIKIDGLQLLMEFREDYLRSKDEAVGTLRGFLRMAPTWSKTDMLTAKIRSSAALALRPEE